MLFILWIKVCRRVVWKTWVSGDRLSTLIWIFLEIEWKWWYLLWYVQLYFFGLWILPWRSFQLFRSSSFSAKSKERVLIVQLTLWLSWVFMCSNMRRMGMSDRVEANFEDDKHPDILQFVDRKLFWKACRVKLYLIQLLLCESHATMSRYLKNVVFAEELGRRWRSMGEADKVKIMHTEIHCCELLGHDTWFWNNPDNGILSYGPIYIYNCSDDILLNMNVLWKMNTVVNDTWMTAWSARVTGVIFIVMMYVYSIMTPTRW